MQICYECPNHRILSKEEEHKLFIKYTEAKKENPKLALKLRDIIIEHNLKFAIVSGLQYIRKYKYVDPNDLKGYAVMGLIAAIDKYDINSGYKFISYAAFWIKSIINKEVCNNESLIRYPSNQKIKEENFFKQNKNNLENIDSYSAMYNNIRGAVSIDQNVGDSDGMCISDVYADVRSEFESDKTMEDSIKYAMGQLTTTEQSIISKLYGLNNEEIEKPCVIGSEMNLSSLNIRNIKKKALIKLRQKQKENVF